MAIHLLIIENSSPATLAEIASGDPRLHLVATCAHGAAAVRQVALMRPAVISLDGDLPLSVSLDTIQSIMASTPTPIVFLGSEKSAEDAAWRAGVVSVMEKPSRPGDPLAATWRNTLVLMSEVPVIRRRMPLTITPPQLAPTLPQRFQLAVVAAGTGVRDLGRVLAALPASFSLPILAQALTGDAEGTVSWLSGQIRLPVRLAQEGEYPLPGYVYLAPQHQHLLYRKGRLVLEGCDTGALDCPSSARLFESLLPVARGCLAVLLPEGHAEGMLGLRQAGAYTVVENRCHDEAGLACERRELGLLGKRLLELSQLRGVDGAT